MNIHLFPKNHARTAWPGRSIHRVRSDRLLFESLEARHMLSAVPGMESNWVHADAGVQVATDADGSVYTARVDAGTYYLSRYDAAGELDPTMDGLPLLVGDGLNCLYVHDDGSIYVGGTFSDTIYFDGTPLTSAGVTDVFVAKFDSEGHYQWSQRFGGRNADTLVAVDVDSNGALVATGGFERTATFETGESLTSRLHRKLSPQFVFKLDAVSGNPDWYRQLQDSGDFVVNDIEVADTDIFVVGRASSVTLNGLTESGTLIVKMDANLDISWVHQITSYWSGNNATRIVHGPGGQLYSTGTFSGTVDFGVTQLQVTTPYSDAYIVQIEDQGAQASNVWARQFAAWVWLSPVEVEVVSVTDADQFGLVVAGQFLQTGHFDYDHTTVPPQESGELTVREWEACLSVSNNSFDVFLVEMQPDLAVERVRQLGGVGDDRGARLAAHPQHDAFHVWSKTRSEIVHTPGGSAENLSGDFESVLVHVNRDAPQLEVVHVFDESREEVVSAVEENRLWFRANIDGAATSLPVLWTVNGVEQTITTANLVLENRSLELGRHTIEARVTENGRTARYAYTFDVTPNAPTNLAGTYASGAIHVTWQDNSESPATEETRFEISRFGPYSTSPSLPGVQLSVIGTVDHDVTSFVDTSVEPGKTYQYVVRSVAEMDGGIEIQSPAVGRVTVVAEQGVLPVVSIEATDANAAESDLDPGMFTVSRTDTEGDLLVQYGISGTADSGADYEPLLNQVTIPAGSDSATIIVVPVDDDDPEGTETVVLTLEVGAAYTVDSAASSATVSIVDNDGGGAPNDIYVWDIYFDQRTRGKKHDARIFIDVNRDSNADGSASGSDAAATGVIATVELREANGDFIRAFSGSTDAAGIFRSDWIRNLDPGTYRAEVVDLAHATFHWNQLFTPNDDDEDGDGKPDDFFTVPA